VLLLALTAASAASARAVADGLGLGVGALAVVALGSRLFPGAADTSTVPEHLPDVAARLSYPVGYWNGLGVLLALALPLLLQAALTTTSWRRAAALGAVPILTAALVLTASRGAIAGCVVGAAIFLAVTADRRRAVVAVLVGAVGSAAAAAVVLLVDDVAAGTSGSATAAVLLAAVCVSTGAAAAAVDRLVFPLPQARVTVAFLVSAAVAGAVLALPRLVSGFSAPPGGRTESETLGAHLTSTAGSGRWQLWESALDAFAHAPVAGIGAGSFESWWSEHRTLALFVRDAHSLYLETLAELGLAGALVLCCALALAFVAAVLRALPAPDRTVRAGLIAAATAFAVCAAFDWMWELTIVGAVGFAALGAALSAPAGRPHVGLELAVLVVACFAIAAQLLPLAVRAELDASRRAAAAGDVEAALAHAAAARDLQPWAASPRAQLALVAEQGGDPAAARRELEEALAHERRDWRLWLVAARLQVKTGDVAAARRSLARARELNPRAPAFTAGG
jgi:tetratricopeptide (TPR) repeat protein